MSGTSTLVYNFIIYFLSLVEFFMVSTQHKNINIAIFIMTMPFKIQKISKVSNLER